MVSLAKAREIMGPEQTLAGNIDPVAVLKNGNPESVIKAIGHCHRQASSRYIVAAGCEVPRGTPKANVYALRDFARSHRP
jgi:uroporphyrinogen-III decarboxylase